MKVRTVNLMGQSAMTPNLIAYRPEYEDGFDYCLDAPVLIPRGSTAHLFVDEDGTIYNMATSVHRERA